MPNTFAYFSEKKILHREKRTNAETTLTFLHDGGEQLVLSRCVEGDEVHAPVPAEVPPVEPVPVLELVPGLPPREEVVVALPFHVGDAWKETTTAWNCIAGTIVNKININKLRATTRENQSHMYASNKYCISVLFNIANCKFLMVNRRESGNNKPPQFSLSVFDRSY